MTTTTRKTERAPMLRESVEQIWLAGLGALALTEEEGTRFFRTLVKKGEGFERQTSRRLDKAMATAREAPGTAMARIESRFDDTMTGVLKRLGVPTKREINSLARRVEGLASSLERAPARRRATTAARTKPAAGARRSTDGARKPARPVA
jgi:poly(hydroxyalkanoate) granule-associated protein